MLQQPMHVPQLRPSTRWSVRGCLRLPVALRSGRAAIPVAPSEPQLCLPAARSYIFHKSKQTENCSPVEPVAIAYGSMITRFRCELSGARRKRRRAGRPCAGTALSHAVAQLAHALGLGTMSAAEDRAFLLDAVADHMRAAVRARRRQRLDGAFEAVERMACAVQGNLKGLVVVVPAGLASSHGVLAFCRELTFKPATACASSGRIPPNFAIVHRPFTAALLERWP